MTLLALYISQFEEGLLNSVITPVRFLAEIAQYYIKQPSKRLRPSLIFLMAQATNGLGSEWPSKSDIWQLTLLGRVLPSQVRLAEIIEMIHVASLLHDDVIDESPVRRGVPSAPVSFGNKRTILSGDFLLGRAMAACAMLGSSDVMDLVSKVICTLVEGELLQAQDALSIASTFQSNYSSVASIPLDDTDDALKAHWDDYLQKTYMKTASLFSHTLQCAVILGGSTTSDPWQNVAAAFGNELGMAFQLIDDALDYEGHSEDLGKPSGASDLRLGLITAPIFFAMEEDARMLPLFARRFQELGDISAALEIVRTCGAISRTRSLACLYAGRDARPLTRCLQAQRRLPLRR
ncbi:terpenoid synthase [Laetiporus sulphureus 93-53]|uniref:(2E,6E)-farnesyl diphosphate synthase n=1 Tax=Laetiporus sulphureus 93-53 TaxID=1314785 RepID=A0A165CWL0_9APHY|nr:terpenoid synthase [Laetiporus sulphureus 93-53]KZT03596.1 terpenoid synthase [Laetiporus sulphureus 93-53]